MQTYQIVLPDGRKYIGSTSRSLYARLKEHRSISRTSNLKVYQAIREVGWDNIKAETIATYPTIEEAITAELELIESQDTIANGLNTFKRASIPNGKQISDTLKKRQLEDPEKETQRVKEFIASTKSEEIRAKMSEARHRMLRNHPEVDLDKARKLAKHYEDMDNRIEMSRKLGGTPIMAYKDGKPYQRFETMSDCTSKLGVHSSNVGKVLRGERHQTNGFYFERIS